MQTPARAPQRSSSSTSYTPRELSALKKDHAEKAHQHVNHEARMAGDARKKAKKSKSAQKAERKASVAKQTELMRLLSLHSASDTDLEDVSGGASLQQLSLPPRRGSSTPLKIFISLLPNGALDHIALRSSEKMVADDPRGPARNRGRKRKFLTITRRDILQFMMANLAYYASDFDGPKKEWFFPKGDKELGSARRGGFSKEIWYKLSRSLDFDPETLCNLLSKEWASRVACISEAALDETLWKYEGKDGNTVFIPRKPNPVGLRNYELAIKLTRTKRPFVLWILQDIGQTAKSAFEVVALADAFLSSKFPTMQIDVIADSFFSPKEAVFAIPSLSNRWTMAIGGMHLAELQSFITTGFKKQSKMLRTWSSDLGFTIQAFSDRGSMVTVSNRFLTSKVRSTIEEKRRQAKQAEAAQPAANSDVSVEGERSPAHPADSHRIGLATIRQVSTTADKERLAGLSVELLRAIYEGITGEETALRGKVTLYEAIMAEQPPESKGKSKPTSSEVEPPNLEDETLSHEQKRAQLRAYLETRTAKQIREYAAGKFEQRITQSLRKAKLISKVVDGIVPPSDLKWLEQKRAKMLNFDPAKRAKGQINEFYATHFNGVDKADRCLYEVFKQTRSTTGNACYIRFLTLTAALNARAIWTEIDPDGRKNVTMKEFIKLLSEEYLAEGAGLNQPEGGSKRRKREDSKSKI